jgi:uncharacterized protein YdeI (YjbR/CyaY-like superfamily)
MAPSPPKPQLDVSSADEWEQWILANPESNGVRLRLRKKNSKQAAPTYDEALDVALCHGWIDGQTGSLDEDFFLILFTPRRAKSIWSQRNRDHIARLVADGRMRALGLAEVERAKADGRWDAAYRQKDAPVPDDLQTALDRSPSATAMFARLSSQNRWAILFRLSSLKRPETRVARIVTYIAMLERGETIYPQKG